MSGAIKHDNLFGLLSVLPSDHAYPVHSQDLLYPLPLVSAQNARD